jgi:hypothetical protein
VIESGDVRSMNAQLVRDLFEPREEPAPARLDLRARDIAKVVWHMDGATVLLDANGTEMLRAFTAANLNRPAVVAIDGMLTGRGAPYVYGVVGSGTIGVPEDALRGPICELLEAAPQAGR